jgi:hypothetical protein
MEYHRRSYKKTKRITQKLTIEKLWTYINVNKDILKSKGLNLILDEFHSGDEYYNESGSQYIFKILEDTYKVGYMYVTEDGDDWAQAECYQLFICDKNGYKTESDSLYELLLNYNMIVRDNKLNELFDSI